MRWSTWLFACGSATVVAVASCSATQNNGGPSGSGAANAGSGTSVGGGGNASSSNGASTVGSGNAGNTGGAPTFFDAGTGSGGSDGGGSNDCPPNAQMIYVTGEPAELWSFWPPTFTFTKIGDVTCTSPTHMTVDRTGTAWIVGGGNVYKTSTTTAACAIAPQWKPHPLAFGDFAVSFVGVTNNDTSLYLLGASSGELGMFDIATGAFQVVGTPSVAASGGDMTSIGDGKLWYLQAYTSPHPLYQIDPTTANVLKTDSVNAPGTGAQALAYFGARFYVFENGIVYEYDPAANTVKTLGPAPLTVTGAGQSTCVPTSTVDAGTPPPTQ